MAKLAKTIMPHTGIRIMSHTGKRATSLVGTMARITGATTATKIEKHIAMKIAPPIAMKIETLHDTMTIIEQKTEGKTGAEACEDGIVVTDHFAAVIDGSTSKTPRRIAGSISNGKYAMQLISEHIMTMPADTTLPEFCQSVTDRIQKAYLKAGLSMPFLRDNPTERLTASCILYSRRWREVWMIGDCQCIIDGLAYTNPKPYEEELAKKRAEVIHRAIDEGMRQAIDEGMRQAIDEGTAIAKIQQHDIGREAIIGELKKACLGQNKEYAVVDGFNILTEGIKTITVPNTETEIILASDGYPRLMPTLEGSEAGLRMLLTDDPLCISLCPATKGLRHGAASFDDRSYLRFKD